MVIKSSEEAKSPPSPGANSQASTATPAPAAAYGQDFQWPPMRGMRHGGGRGGMRGGFGMYMGRGRHLAHAQRPEVVSLEGEAGPSDPFPHQHPGHRAFWGAPAPPDPPLAPMPPVAPDAPNPPHPPPFGFGGPHQPDFASGLASWIGDVASHFGAPPPPPAPGAPGAPGAPSTPRSGPFGHGGPMAWGMRGRGGWRGGWGRPTPSHGHEHHHHHHHAGPHGRFPFPHHEHGPIRPKMNIQHNGNVFTVTLELPGLQKEEVDISVADGVLTISGEFVDNAPGEGTGAFPPDYESDGEGFELMDDDACDTQFNGAEQEIEGGVAAMNLEESQPHDHTGGDCGNDGFVLRERRFGPFKRSVKLPSWVDVDTIKATMAHGVLSLVVEKPQAPESTGPPKKIQVL